GAKRPISWFSRAGSRPVSVIVTLDSSGNTATFTTVDTLTSGTGADTINFTGILSDASIDLGAGADVLTLGDLGNTATIANTETVTGGTGDDAVTLTNAL